MGAEFDVMDIGYADVVLIGEVEEYKVLKGVGFLTINLERQMVPKGEEINRTFHYGHTIRASWPNSTFQLPEKMPKTRSIFALRRAGSAQPPLRGPSGYIPADPKDAEFTILQAPCAPPFIMPYSEMGSENIQEILDGGHPPSFDYHYPDIGYTIRVKELEIYLMAMAALTTLLLLTNALTLWKWRSLRSVRTATPAVRSPDDSLDHVI